MKRWIVIFLVSIQFVFAQESEKPGNASYYNNSFHGRLTSDGEVYDKNDFTAAHLTLPFNSILLVTNKKNNKSAVVRINDRGPFIRSRIIDLSQAAAIKLGMIPLGVVEVKITKLNYLERFHFNESRFQNDGFLDCFGHKKELSNISIYIWETENLKHAMYMASSLTLEYNIITLIKSEEKNKKRNYIIIISGIENEKKAAGMITVFRNSGFSKSAIYKSL